MAAQRQRNGARRPYARSGVNVVTRALPYLVERVADPAISDDTLSPVERGARDWRSGVLADLGGADAVSTARRALLDAATGTVVVLYAVDAYVFRLAASDALANKRSRRLFPIVEQRMRVADSLARQLQALGLDRVPRPVQSLGDVLAEYTATPSQEGGTASQRHEENGAAPSPLPDEERGL